MSGRRHALPAPTGKSTITYFVHDTTKYAITIPATTNPPDLVSRASIKNTLDLRGDGGIKPQTTISTLETHHQPPELVGEISLIQPAPP